jgi:signal transduction histidine kinase
VKYFNDYSIKRKLVLLLVALVTFTLLLQGSILVYNDIKNLKTNIIENLSVLASAIGSMSRAAILFEDARAGGRILSSLENEGQIDLAVIYKADDQVFVTYTKDKSLKIEPPTLVHEGEAITKKGIEIVKNIVLEGEVLGKIYIKANLDQMEAKVENQLVLVVGIFSIILLISIPISVLLQRFISEPILSLAETAQKVSKLTDYSLRATYEGKDELGVLYSGFNEMLSQIQSRDQTLEQYRSNLEELVNERTRELEAAQKELVSKEKLAVMGTLSAMVSHEIRNPLGTIRNTIFNVKQLISKNNYAVEPELERIERNVVRCDHIIEELLDYTRLQEKVLEPVKIDPWLKELIDEQSIPEAMIVTTSFKADTVVHIDIESFRRAVINVTQNGIQAMTKVKTGKKMKPSDELKDMRLTIESRIYQDRVEVIVEDNGEGIPQADLDKIYEPLYSTKSFGVGLGLPIVKGIMEQHLGGIEIDSQVGVGTKVTLWVPLKKGN